MEMPITVLVAEDDRDQREILTEVLECEGYRVLCSSSPAQTLEQLEQSPDVVLLDVHGASGPEVERAIDGKGYDRPAVIIVSGDCRAVEIAARISAADCVEKPYDLNLLLAIVARCANRRPRFSLLDGGLQAAS